MEMMNKLIGNSKDMVETREKCDVKIDGFQNKAHQGGKNVKRYERCVSRIVDDDFTEMSDENYDSVPLGHEDLFGQPRSCRYEEVRRDGYFVQGDYMGNFSYYDEADRSLGSIKMKIPLFQAKNILRVYLK
jgi:hypothetical protein